MRNALILATIIVIIIIIIVIVTATRNSNDSNSLPVTGGKHYHSDHSDRDCGCKRDCPHRNEECGKCKKKRKDCKCPDPCPECPPCNCPDCPVCKGGIGDRCAINQQCVTGLVCDADGTCVCPRPNAPTEITAFQSGAGEVQIDWNDVIGADFYHVLLSGPTPMTELNHVASQITFTDLAPGNYSVVIFSVSATCGFGSDFLEFGGIEVRPSCFVDQDCPFGTFCSNGQFCIECSNDDQCPGASKCINSTCKECATTADCSGDDKCFNGECKQCLVDANCPGGLPRCVNETCVECAFNSDCGVGQICINGSCQAV